MNEIQLHNIDLNLLVVLDVLLQEQSVSQAARRLHRTPSAVSHALNRLRDLLEDEVLVRDGRRMRPTRRAAGLAESLPRVLDQVRRTLAPPSPFDPSTSTRAFRLAAPDFLSPVVPHLLRRLGRHAPHSSVELVPVGPAALRDVAEGRYDGLVAPSFIAHEGLRSRPLGAWPWAVFARPDHPALAAWSLAAWSAYPHLRVRTSGARGDGPVDRALRPFGGTRTIGAVVPHFSMAPAVLAHTDLLFTAPFVAVDAATPLAHRPVPFDLPPMALSLFRSAVAGDEPAVHWFLGHVAAAMEQHARTPPVDDAT